MIADDFDSAKSETPGVVQTLLAGLGLVGLVLVWALAVIPCALWLMFNLLFGRQPPDPMSRLQRKPRPARR